jgi:phage terminase small subunit
MALTDKQKRFAEEYLIDLNATQATIRAGYSEKTAYSQCERLLRNVEVQAAISEGQKSRSQRTGITADRVV